MVFGKPEQYSVGLIVAILVIGLAIIISTHNAMPTKEEIIQAEVSKYNRFKLGSDFCRGKGGLIDMKEIRNEHVTICANGEYQTKEIK